MAEARASSVRLRIAAHAHTSASKGDPGAGEAPAERRQVKGARTGEARGVDPQRQRECATGQRNDREDDSGGRWQTLRCCRLLLALEQEQTHADQRERREQNEPHDGLQPGEVELPAVRNGDHEHRYREQHGARHEAARPSCGGR